MTVNRLSESSGWVQGVTHHNSPNHGTGMAVPAGVTGVVMHTMVGNLPGTDSVFMNPSFQASAHFGIAQDGKIIQWVSVRGGIAWHCADGNSHWYGIEHADNGSPANPLTDAQLTASAQLVELLSRSSVGHFTLQVSNSTVTQGYGVHRMGGAAWGGHSCPQTANGTGPRMGQRNEIIRRAKILREHGTYPAAGGAAGPVRHVADGSVSLAHVAQARNTTVGQLVLTSAAHLSPANLTRLVRYLFGPGRDADMPSGLVYWTKN